MAKKKSSGVTKLAEAVGTGAVLAAAAGYYFYGTQNAKKHRSAASAWAKNLKKDVVKQAANVKKLDAQSVSKIVDQAAKSYHTAKGVSVVDVKAAAKELKKNWKMIEKEIAPSKKVTRAVTKAVKTAKKTIRSTEKKVVKKAAKAKKAVKKSVAKKKKR